MTDQSAHPWVETTWGVIEPDDVVRAPDGSEWVVEVKIGLSFHIRPAGLPRSLTDGIPDGVWTRREAAEKVTGWRFAPPAPAAPGTLAYAVSCLVLAGFDVEPVT